MLLLHTISEAIHVLYVFYIAEVFGQYFQFHLIFSLFFAFTTNGNNVMTWTDLFNVQYLFAMTSLSALVSVVTIHHGLLIFLDAYFIYIYFMDLSLLVNLLITKTWYQGINFLVQKE